MQTQKEATSASSTHFVKVGKAQPYWQQAYKKSGNTHAPTPSQGRRSYRGGSPKIWNGPSTHVGSKQSCSDCGALRKRLETLEKTLDRLTNPPPQTSREHQRPQVVKGSQQKQAPNVPGMMKPETWKLFKPSANPELRSMGGRAKSARSGGVRDGFMTRSISAATLSPTSRSKRCLVRKSSEKPANTMTQNKKQASAQTEANTSKDLKNRPGYKYEPTKEMEDIAETAKTATDDMADKPVFNNRTVPVSKGRRLDRTERRAARRDDVDVVDDLYWFLHSEFMFVPRTAEVLRQMKAKSKQFLAKHDVTGLSLQVQYQLVISTITRCMDVRPEEQLCRQALKNPDANEERLKQQKLVSDGHAGHEGSWFTKTMHSLPKAKK